MVSVTYYMTSNVNAEIVESGTDKTKMTFQLMNLED